MIDAWLQSTSEQSRRALQDTVVGLGPALGFETAFGTYHTAPGAARCDGHWRSRHRVRIILDIRGDRMPRPKLDGLAQSVAAMAALPHAAPDPDPDERCIGVCVVLPAEASRHAAAKASTEKSTRDLRVVSIRSLLALADMVSSGRLAHDEVAQLFMSGTSLDLVVGLLQRAPAAADTQSTPDEPQLAPVDHEPNYWLATIVRNGAATAEQLLEFVVGKRHVLGVTDAAKGQMSSRPGDWVCFFVPGKGIVGHGRVLSLAENGSIRRLVRASDRFERLIRLNDVELYDAAVVPAPEQQQRLGVTLGGNGTAGPLLGEISRQEFLNLTAIRGLNASGGCRSCGSENLRTGGRSSNPEILRILRFLGSELWPERGADAAGVARPHQHGDVTLAELRMAEHDVVLADRNGEVGERRVAHRATIDPDLSPRRRVDVQPAVGR